VTEVWLAFALALPPWAALTFVRLRRFLHIAQLEEYFTGQLLRWLAANPDRYLHAAFLMPALAGTVLAAVLVGVSAFRDALPQLDAAAVLVWGGIGAYQAVIRPREPARARKPLVMTARAKRLLAGAFLLAAALVGAAVGLGALAGGRTAAVAGVAAAAGVCAFAGHLLAAANVLLYPVEAAMRRRFEVEAARRVREQAPRVIAITGSAGKTTTKELVAHLLSARHRVLKTPASFNTPMGIARTVNGSLSGHEYFVVEMGAYKRGEIAKLCRLVGGTDVSVITTVNAQHLERFGSLEKTAQAKWEIVEGLKPGGTAVLNFDVAAIRERAQQAGGPRVLSFGLDPGREVDLRGSGVVENEGGLELDVAFRGECVHVATELMAQHNAVNVLAAMGVGLLCGLDLPYMAAALRRFRPPEHRLQPRNLSNGVLVLDDAYNANPEGIIGALEVLGRYEPRRRILVTPGLIEMGSEKAAYHARIGEAAARTCDVALLVGPKQTADIKAAMLAASFPPERLYVTRSLDEAQAVIGRIAAPGDVILYANDLPDQFDESLRV